MYGFDDNRKESEVVRCLYVYIVYVDGDVDGGNFNCRLILACGLYW